MSIIDEKEVGKLIQNIVSDYKGGKSIDIEGVADILSKPDKSEVIGLVKKLLQIVFPGYFRDKTFKIYNLENEFSVLLEDIFYYLNKQVRLALSYREEYGDMSDDSLDEVSYDICKTFFAKIPSVREYLETDLQATLDGDPAAECKEEIILAYPGLRAIAVYRLAHELYVLNVPLLPRLMTEYAHSETGIDINPGATIGKSFFIDHGTGIVIGETSIIGENVKIYQGVTIGALSTRGGRKLSGAKRHPTIEDNVTIYSGASVLGGDTVIGRGAVIGGNAFITSSIPADTRVYIKNQELEYKNGHRENIKEVID